MIDNRRRLIESNSAFFLFVCCFTDYSYVVVLKNVLKKDLEFEGQSIQCKVLQV